MLAEFFRLNFNMGEQVEIAFQVHCNVFLNKK